MNRIHSAVVAWAVFVGSGPEPPLVGRPVDFSHVVGRYTITSSATPTEVAVEEPITLTVRIQGKGPVEQRPVREQLHLFPDDMPASFYVENPEKDRVLDDGVWEFVYWLRPKSDSVAAIPSAKLVYYNDAQGKFETAYAEEIAIRVRPNSNAVMVRPTLDEAVLRLHHIWSVRWHVAAVVGVSVCLAVCGACALVWIRRRGRVWLIVCFTGMVGATTLGAIDWIALKPKAAPVAYVRMDDTPLYVGNSVKYAAHPVTPTLRRGAEARLLSRRGDWLHVRLTPEIAGWLHRDAALIIE